MTLPRARESSDLCLCNAEYKNEVFKELECTTGKKTFLCNCTGLDCRAVDNWASARRASCQSFTLR